MGGLLLFSLCLTVGSGRACPPNCGVQQPNSQAFWREQCSPHPPSMSRSWGHMICLPISSSHLMRLFIPVLKTMTIRFREVNQITQSHTGADGLAPEV